MDSYKTKTQLAYEWLRDAILDGRYQPGARIIVEQLALELEVSKVPIREAVTRLVGQGWLELRPHAGAVVRELSAAEALDIALLRGAVESAAVLHAGPCHTAESFAAIEDLLDRMDKLAAEKLPQYPILNAEFHTAMIEPCPHRQLRETGQILIQQALRFRPVRFLPSYGPESQAEHRAIVYAVKARDFTQAAELTRNHVEGGGRRLHGYALMTSVEKEGPAQ